MRGKNQRDIHKKCREEIDALRAENEMLRQRLSQLEKTIAEQNEIIRELKARLNQNSTNSSRPPSSDPPWLASTSKQPSGRKAGGQPGHQGTTRKLLPPDQVNRTIKIPAEKCRICSKRFSTKRSLEDPQSIIHQVIDIPPQVATVTEYQIEGRKCCGKITWASLPNEISQSIVGTRLQAIISVLSGQYHMSRREIEDALPVLFGAKAELSLGTIVEVEKRTSNALQIPYEQARNQIEQSEVANADETGWSLGKSRAWMWGLCTKEASLYRIDARRNRRACKKLLGKFKGILGSDRHGAYAYISVSRRQLCLAHIDRDFEKITDRGGTSGKIGESGSKILENIFDIWHEYKDGKSNSSQMQQKMEKPQIQMRNLFMKGALTKDSKTSKFCKRLLKLFPALWTFTRVEAVEPTNNDAERMMRKAVIWRKISFGCVSDSGCRFAERILTVVQTLRKQGLNVLDYIEQSIIAGMLKKTPPPIISDSG